MRLLDSLRTKDRLNQTGRARSIMYRESCPIQSDAKPIRPSHAGAGFSVIPARYRQSQGLGGGGGSLLRNPLCKRDYLSRKGDEIAY